VSVSPTGDDEARASLHFNVTFVRRR